MDSIKNLDLDNNSFEKAQSILTYIIKNQNLPRGKYDFIKMKCDNLSFNCESKDLDKICSCEHLIPGKRYNVSFSVTKEEWNEKIQYIKSPVFTRKSSR